MMDFGSCPKASVKESPGLRVAGFKGLLTSARLGHSLG